MKRVEIEVIDDIDGKPAAETITFAFRGVEYDIDLSAKNVAAMEKAFAKYIDKARKSGGKKGKRVLHSVPTGKPDLHAVS